MLSNISYMYAFPLSSQTSNVDQLEMFVEICLYVTMIY